MQMLFIIPLLKTENPYYIIVNILTDNGENTMQNEKTSVLVLAAVRFDHARDVKYPIRHAVRVHVRGERRTPTAEQLRRGCGYFRRARVKPSWRRRKPASAAADLGGRG